MRCGDSSTERCWQRVILYLTEVDVVFVLEAPGDEAEIISDLTVTTAESCRGENVGDVSSDPWVVTFGATQAYIHVYTKTYKWVSFKKVPQNLDHLKLRDTSATQRKLYNPVTYYYNYVLS